MNVWGNGGFPKNGLEVIFMKKLILFLCWISFCQASHLARLNGFVKRTTQTAIRSNVRLSQNFLKRAELTAYAQRTYKPNVSWISRLRNALYRLYNQQPQRNAERNYVLLGALTTIGLRHMINQQQICHAQELPFSLDDLADPDRLSGILNQTPEHKKAELATQTIDYLADYINSFFKYPILKWAAQNYSQSVVIIVDFLTAYPTHIAQHAASVSVIKFLLSTENAPAIERLTLCVQTHRDALMCTPYGPQIVNLVLPRLQEQVY